MEVEVADAAAPVVQRAEQRQQLSSQRGVGDAGLDFALEARQQLGQTGDDGGVASQLERDEVSGQAVDPLRSGGLHHLQQRGALDPVHDHAGATVDGDRAVRVRDGEAGIRQERQHRRLEGGQAVPVGPVELEHPALAVGEDLRGTTLGQQLHVARSVPQPGPERSGGHRQCRGVDGRNGGEVERL